MVGIDDFVVCLNFFFSSQQQRLSGLGDFLSILQMLGNLGLGWRWKKGGLAGQVVSVGALRRVTAVSVGLECSRSFPAVDTHI